MYKFKKGTKIIRFTGKENQPECQDFVGDACIRNGWYDVVVIQRQKDRILAKEGDYIVKTPANTFFIIEGDAFENSFEKIEGDNTCSM